MVKKEEDGICIFGSPKKLGYAIYQLLTKRGTVDEVLNMEETKE